MAYSVIAGHEDHITTRFLNNTYTIVKWKGWAELIFGPKDVRSTVEPGYYRQFQRRVFDGFARNVKIQKETVSQIREPPICVSKGSAAYLHQLP